MVKFVRFYDYINEYVYDYEDDDNKNNNNNNNTSNISTYQKIKAYIQNVNVCNYVLLCTGQLWVVLPISQVVQVL